MKISPKSSNIELEKNPLRWVGTDWFSDIWDYCPDFILAFFSPSSITRNIYRIFHQGASRYFCHQYLPDTTNQVSSPRSKIFIILPKNIGHHSTGDDDTCNVSNAALLSIFFLLSHNVEPCVCRSIQSTHLVG